MEAVYWSTVLHDHLRATGSPALTGPRADMLLAARYLLAHAHALVPVVEGGVLRWPPMGERLPSGEGRLVWGRAAYRDQFEPVPVDVVLDELAVRMDRSRRQPVRL